MHVITIREDECTGDLTIAIPHVVSESLGIEVGDTAKIEAGADNLVFSPTAIKPPMHGSFTGLETRNLTKYPVLLGEVRETVKRLKDEGFDERDISIALLELAKSIIVLKQNRNALVNAASYLLD